VASLKLIVQKQTMSHENKEWRELFNRDDYYEITAAYLLVIDDTKRKYYNIFDLTLS